MKRSVHLVVTKIATIVEGTDTTPMSKRPPTREEKNHLEDEAQEMNHLVEREGVEKTDMNEDLPGEARIRRGKTGHQGATQGKSIKLM